MPINNLVLKNETLYQNENILTIFDVDSAVPSLINIGQVFWALILVDRQD